MADVVLLHGFTQGPASWDPMAGLLEPSHRIVRPTLPGHGGAGATADSFETAAATLVDEGPAVEGAVPSVWMGYSMGGRFALRVALDRPERVSGLVLLGATAGLSDPAQREARMTRDETLASGLERKGLDRFLDGWLTQPIFKRLPRSAAGLEERRANTVAGLASSLRRHGTGAMEPLWDRLGELAMPVLVLAGELDTHFVAVAFRLAEVLPDGAEVAFVPGAGHAAHLERPAAVATILERFLARHGSPSATR